MKPWADMDPEERMVTYHCFVTGPRYGTPPPGNMYECGWISTGAHYHCIIGIDENGKWYCPYEKDENAGEYLTEHARHT